MKKIYECKPDGSGSYHLIRIFPSVAEASRETGVPATKLKNLRILGIATPQQT